MDVFVLQTHHKVTCSLLFSHFEPLLLLIFFLREWWSVLKLRGMVTPSEDESTTDREQPPAPPPSRFPIKIASICGKIWLWAIWNFLFIKNFARYRCELLLSSSFNLVGISRCGRTSNWIEDFEEENSYLDHGATQQSEGRKKGSFPTPKHCHRNQPSRVHSPSCPDQLLLLF